MQAIFGVDARARAARCCSNGRPYAPRSAARRDRPRRLPRPRGPQAPRPGAADVGRAEHVAAGRRQLHARGAGSTAARERRVAEAEVDAAAHQDAAASTRRS